MKKTTLILVYLSYSVFLWGEDKLNIYMTDTPSWTIKSHSYGTASASGNTGIASSSSSTMVMQNSLVTDAMGHFRKHKDCKDFALTVSEETASYIFVFGHQNEYRENVMVVNSDEQVIYAGNALRLKNVVKDACKSVKEDLER